VGGNSGIRARDRRIFRQLFNKETSGKNFFNDILEPLFEALATPRKTTIIPALTERFSLNGGLFEPICGYNWQEQDILLKNETLKEVFDTFDLYNFTVSEDEPLEKRLLLIRDARKGLENYSEVIDRKSKGAFIRRARSYFMCQESMINYLDKTQHTPNEQGRGTDRTVREIRTADDSSKRH
jgi:hypothetical protein